jgi:uncharacterized LabA/DUF88 family protein
MSVSDDEPARQRAAVFADVQNLYYTTRDRFGRSLDYRQLWQELSAEFDVVRAVAYATDRSDDGQRRFQSALRHIGFDVRLKPYVTRADGSAKGDWDVGITIDIMDIAPTVDTVILLSGDGDFALLLDAIRERHNVASIVYGVDGLTARDLKASATSYRPIEGTLLQR